MLRESATQIHLEIAMPSKDIDAWLLSLLVDQQVMKHVDKKSPDQPRHWAECERNRTPYVEVADHGKDHCTVFYDVTNLPVDLDAVSDAMRRVYASYVEFCLLPQADVEPFLHRPYLFQMMVRREHAGCFADTLFDYLKNASSPGI